LPSGAKIGLGVGIPLAVIGVVSLIASLLLFRRRKSRDDYSTGGPIRPDTQIGAATIDRKIILPQNAYENSQELDAEPPISELGDTSTVSPNR
jgi:hypothetical protein